MQNRLPILLSSVAIGIVLAGAALTLVGGEVNARAMAVQSFANMDAVQQKINPELFKLVSLIPKGGHLSPVQASESIQSVRSMLKKGDVSSGMDYLHAAKILAEGSTTEDALLAHDLSVVSLALGNLQARSLAASTQDQVLTRLRHEQRFGTQVVPAGNKLKVLPTASDVSDGMRFILGLPALREANRLAADGKHVQPESIPMALRPQIAPVAVASVD